MATSHFISTLIAGLLTLSGVVLHAQVTQSSILGNVTDSSGAAVAGAKVIVKNEGTNLQRTIDTDVSGDYRISGLETGFYSVAVTAPGFKTFEQTRIDLASAQIKRVDARLELGSVDTKITVEGGASQVETETATLSNLKTSRDFAELPLSIYGRGWANITNVTAGVQSSSGFEVNGARDTANNFTTDGISYNDIISSRNTPNGFSGDIENFQEIKILTANTSAEYPQVAQFAAVSKAGTNELHGSFYWGNFNSKFSARSWADEGKPSFTNHNMFALNGGGPVYIPHVYDGRNRTFFFVSYSGARYRIGNRTYAIVPTAAMRNGDFSALSGQIKLVDPLNGHPFPNNVIPSNRISSVSKAVQDMVYPDPNQTGQGDFGLTNNFYGDPGGKFDSDVYSFRVDQRITNKNTLYTRVGLTINNKDSYPGVLKNGFGDGNWLGNHPGRSVVISDTHTFSPAIVNEVKLGYSRDFGRWYDVNYGQDVVSQIGLQGINNPGNDPSIGGMPGFSFGGAIPVYGLATWANGNFQAQNTYQIIDNLSWYRGRHNLKLGVDIRRLQINDQNKPLDMRGNFTFDDRLSGLAYANFLLGYPSSATRAIARPNAYPRSTVSGFYIQDDFKLSQRITLNYGLRYEYQTPWVEKYDRMFTFDPNNGSMVTAGSSIPTDLVPSVAATLPIVTAQSAGLPVRSLMETDANNWSPRLGLAIRPFADATTVVRLGYGVYTQIWPGLLALNATGGPWQSTESFILADPNVPSIQFPDPFLTTSEFSGIQSISGVSGHFPNERTQQWNASIGRQIWGTAVDIGYVGTKAQNIPYSEDLNLLRPSTLPFDPARRPYPRFDSAALTQSGGSSIYHGFTIQADRRFASGFGFNVNYTWAKALTDVDLRDYSAGAQQNQYARYLERADDRNLRRHQLRFSYIYDLPVGKAKRFGSSMPGVADAIIGGWQLAGITTMLSGARLSPGFSGTDPANTNQYGGRPDRIGDGNFDSSEMRDRIKSRQPIFDENAFVTPADGRGFYGNSARYILTGPGQVVWNMGIHKNWLLTERSRLQFRWEMFNAFNRPNFANPSTNLQSGSFGLVTYAGEGRSMLFGLRLDY